MNKFLAAFLLAAISASSPVFADAEKGAFSPPMRGEKDPFPARSTGYNPRKLQMENLGRGVVAVRTGEGGRDIFVSWRYLSKDPTNICFNVYRDNERITREPVEKGTWFLDKGAWRGAAIEYEVRPVLSAGEQKKQKGVSSPGSPVLQQKDKSAKFHELKRGCGMWKVPEDAPIGAIDIPIAEPSEDVLPDGSRHGHHANDCSCGDVDGDGEYEIFLKYESNASRDNIGGFTGCTWFYCLKMNGTCLWKINMGFNLNAGPHYQPFVVADFDGDGKAEMIVRTAPGTVDGTGCILTDAGVWVQPNKVEFLKPENTILVCDANFKASDKAVGDYRRNCHPLETPEYLTVFDGKTGKALDTVKYDPQFGNPWIWGDHAKSIGNRSHRFLASTAYLDGVHPSAVMCRGYYNRSCLAAWDWDGHNLRERWFFDSETPRWKGKGYSCQGFHNLRVCDVDFDGKDEIVYGSMVVDDNGEGLYTTRMGHGDQIHIVQSTPNHVGLQVWTCHEHSGDGVVLRDARTGKMIFREPRRADVGNCLAADADPFSPGVEFFAAASIGAFDYTGRWLGIARNKGMYYQTLRFAIWWLGDMSHSLLPGSDGVYDYSVRYRGTGLRQKFEDCEANSASKGNPCLVADIFGDWREEVLYRRKDGKAIRMYVSTFPTDYRFWSLMEDPCYRNSVAAENAGYNVCPEPSFYFGPDLRGHGVWFRGCYIP